MNKLGARTFLLAVAAVVHVPVAVAWPLTKEDLTFLSFQVSDQVQAEPRTMQSIERHLRAIARQAPEVKDIEPHHRFRGRDLLLKVDGSTAEAISAGKYDAWASLHSKLRVRRVQVQGQMISISYDENYNAPRLAAEYGRLPGVISVSPNWFIGDGSRIYIQREGQDWHYIFDIGSVDCIAGCARHDLQYFVVDGSGGVSAGDRWSSESTDPVPAWVERWRTLRERH